MGIAVGLALQNILADLFSSFAIYFDKPFQVGDFITVGEHSGTVEHIGIKTTRIRALQGEELVISNQELTSARVQNFRKLEERRISFKIGVNDLAVRKKQALKFLEKGHKLRIELILRGREKAHFDRARESMYNFVNSLKEDYDIRIESPVKKAGGRLHMIVAREK